MNVNFAQDSNFTLLYANYVKYVNFLIGIKNFRWTLYEIKQFFDTLFIIPSVRAKINGAAVQMRDSRHSVRENLNLYGKYFAMYYQKFVEGSLDAFMTQKAERI